MTAPTFNVGVTGRGLGTRDPLLHASTGRRRTRTGETLEALCGAAVHERRARIIRGGDPFRPDHRRACPDCAEAVWSL